MHRRGKARCFVCELEKDSGDSVTAIVKFVEQYGIEAHRLMVNKGYAPPIIAFVENVTS